MRKDLLLSDERLQRELWALALLLLAILLALSFVPLAHLGEGAERIFPTGNIVGRVGSLLSSGAWAVFGVAASVIALIPAIWAIALGGRMERATAIRYTVLGVGILMLVPAAVRVFGGALAPTSAMSVNIVRNFRT